MYHNRLQAEPTTQRDSTLSIASQSATHAQAAIVAIPVGAPMWQQEIYRIAAEKAWADMLRLRRHRQVLYGIGDYCWN